MVWTLFTRLNCDFIIYNGFVRFKTNWTFLIDENPQLWQGKLNMGEIEKLKKIEKKKKFN